MLLLGLRPEIRRVSRGAVGLSRREYLGSVSLFRAPVARLRRKPLARVGVRQIERHEVEVSYGERIRAGDTETVVGARAGDASYREVGVEALVRVGSGEVGAVAVGPHGETLHAHGAGARHRRALRLGVSGKPSFARIGVVPTTPTTRGRAATLAAASHAAIARGAVVQAPTTVVVGTQGATVMMVVHQQSVFDAAKKKPSHEYQKQF